MTPYPYEAVVVAALNVWAELLKLERERIDGMDPELRKREDAVRVAGFERIEKILSKIEGLGK